MSWRAEDHENPEVDEHANLVHLGELLDRKDQLTELLRNIDIARAEAREAAGLPLAGDDDDTEEQTLLRVGLHEVDQELERAEVFSGG